jgi:hypothetical protein
VRSGPCSRLQVLTGWCAPRADESSTTLRCLLSGCTSGTHCYPLTVNYWATPNGWVTELADALRRGREVIAAALADARAELADLDARRAELLALIAEAEAALGVAPEQNDAGLTLHQALAQILRESRSCGRTATNR